MKRLTLTLAAIAAALIAYGSGAVVGALASQPKWGNPPRIEQHGGTLAVADRGDWFTQEGERPTRTCVQWFRWTGGHWEVVGGGRAPMRTRPDEHLPCEDAHQLGIGPENAGRQLRALVGAGVVSVEHDDGAWVEWGYKRSNDSGEEAYSNTLTVTAWQPPRPPGPTADVPAAIAVLRADVLRLRDEGADWPAIKLQASWRACRLLAGCR